MIKIHKNSYNCICIEIFPHYPLFSLFYYYLSDLKEPYSHYTMFPIVPLLLLFKRLKSTIFSLYNFAPLKRTFLVTGLKWYNRKVISLFVMQTNLLEHCPDCFILDDHVKWRKDLISYKWSIDHLTPTRSSRSLSHLRGFILHIFLT